MDENSLQIFRSRSIWSYFESTNHENWRLYKLFYWSSIQYFFLENSLQTVDASFSERIQPNRVMPMHWMDSNTQQETFISKYELSNPEFMFACHSSEKKRQLVTLPFVHDISKSVEWY